MERRKALKQMGVALGYTVATPTLINLMQACKTDTAITWTPQFFSPAEGNDLIHLVDILLPASDTPSASEVQVHKFIDSFTAEVMDEKQQGFWKMLFASFRDTVYEASGKEAGSMLGPEDLEPVLAASLQVSPEEKEAYDTQMQEYMVQMEAGGAGTLDPEVAAYSFATNLRGFSIWAYKTSEYVGEKVLPYLPVPGTYIACGDVDELTGGKVWSPNR